MIIKNAKILNHSFNFEYKDLFTSGACISGQEHSDSSTVIDAKGLTVLPGLVDIHLHGANGADFMDASDESLQAIASYQASCGVTSIAPASMTMDLDSVIKAVHCAASFVPEANMASIDGIYMEGPFVSLHKLGAQNSDYVKSCDLDFFGKVVKASNNLVKAVVVAPETEGAMEFIKAVSPDVTVSLGHTACDYETAKQAFFCGATQLTHTFNAMNGLNHRAPGPIGAAFDKSDVYVELISDGVHVHESMIRALFCLFKGRVILISDSMAATGLKDGKYALGGQDVYVKGNRACLEDGTLAGSVTNLFECMKFAVRSGVPLEQAVYSASYNPAKKIGAHSRIGSIREGALANLLIVDDSLNLRGVILRGNLLYFKE